MGAGGASRVGLDWAGGWLAGWLHGLYEDSKLGLPYMGRHFRNKNTVYISSACVSLLHKHYSGRSTLEEPGTR